MNKEKLKKTKIYNLLRFLKDKRPFRVEYDFGYICKPKQIERLHKRVFFQSSNNSFTTSSKPAKFIFIGDKNINSTMRIAVFGDILSKYSKSCNYEYYIARELINKKLTKLHKLFFSINKIIPLPYKNKWEKLYTTSQIQFDDNYDYFIIFLPGAYFVETWSQPLLWKKINEYSKDHFCKKILYLVDPVEKFPTVKCWFSFFDLLCTYSPGDAEIYNMKYLTLPCVHFDLKNKNKIKYDVYLRAMDNGRAEIIKKVYEYLSSNGVKCNFIINTNKNIKSMPGLLYTTNRITYEEMIKEELNSNVILEIVLPDNKSAGTLRHREAIIYNKKLLTNDPFYKIDNYYKTKNIQYFSKIKDINIDWLKDKTPITYNYKDDFTVKEFCNSIKEIYK